MRNPELEMTRVSAIDVCGPQRCEVSGPVALTGDRRWPRCYVAGCMRISPRSILSGSLGPANCPFSATFPRYPRATTITPLRLLAEDRRCVLILAIHVRLSAGEDGSEI